MDRKIVSPPYITLDNEAIKKAVKECFPFEKFRKYQEITINKVLQAYREFKYVVIEAPTGSGKSVIAKTVATVLNKYSTKKDSKTYLNVPYKTLQDQYIKDFPDMIFMKGSSNYKCQENLEANCSNGPCKVPTYNSDLINKHRAICEFSLAKKEALLNNLTLFNTAAYFTFMNFTRIFPPRKLVVMDECHAIESALMHFISIKLTSESLVKFGITEIPDYLLPSDYLGWLKEIHQKIRNIAQSIIRLVKDESEKLECSAYSLMSDEQKKLLSLSLDYVDRVDRLLKISKDYSIDDFFVLAKGSYAEHISLEFKPIQVGVFAPRYLLPFGDCFLFLSATIYIDNFCKTLGVNREEVKYIRIPMTFPKNRRFVYIDNYIGSLNNKNLENKLPNILNRIENISHNYKNYKGAIHTHSYKINNYIMKHASPKLKKRLITHKGGLITTGLSREEALQEHMTRKDTTILISPMMYEGVDLKDDLCRWQILCKCPFSSLVDPQISRRLEIDPEWYQWQTVLKIIQACGRAVRSDTDWAFTFILDRVFLSLFERNSYMFPEWFIEAIIVKKES